MTPTSNQNQPETVAAQPAPLPRRDRFLLPLIAAATIFLICVTSEIVARRAFPASPENPLDCMVLNDPATGIRAQPNTVCHGQQPETPLVEYRFNSCGDRTAQQCGPKPASTYRIVIIGSSFAEGFLVPREQSFAALLPVQLSQRLGRKIEVYNTAVQQHSTRSISLQMDQIFALQPDLILWPITSWDFANADFTTFARGTRPPDDLPSIAASIASSFHKEGFGPALGVAIALSIEFVKNNRTQFMLRHLLYLSETQYDRSAKSNPEEVTYLRVNLAPDSLRRLQQFSQISAEIEKKAQAAHVPLVVTLLPLRLQASMIALNAGPPEFDPYQPSRLARTVVESNGATFLDILPAFHRVPSTSRYYYPVDGHPNAQGHALLANLLTNALTSGALPALTALPPSGIVPSLAALPPGGRP
jgi:hypothetical protein